MKIAYVHDAIYPYVKGGGEKRIYEISKGLVKRGHEVHIFGMRWWGKKITKEQEGVWLHGVCKPSPLYSKGRRSIRSAISFARGVSIELPKCDFDVVDCYQAPYLHAFPAKIVSSFKKFPLVITWHEVWREYWKEYLGTLGVVGKVLERIIILKLADAIVAVSNQTKNDLISLGANPRKIHVVPNGIDLELISSVAPSRERFDVVYLGRLIKPKNVDLLIKAISFLKKDFPKISLGIMGDGPEKKNLIDLTHRLGVEKHVKFFGFIEDYKKIISIMKSAKIFVIPSTQEGGASIVTQEAYACGLPVIAVDHPLGIDKKLILDGKTGYLVKVNVNTIATRMRALISDTHLRRIISKNALRFVKKYDWDNITRRIEKVYAEVSSLADKE